VNNLPPTINSLSVPLIFANGTVIIYSTNFDFCILSNRPLSCISKCYNYGNKLALNLDRANIIKFIKINSAQYPLNIGYNDKYIEESVNIKFLGLQIHNHFKLKNHTDHLVPTLSAACYAVRSVTYQQH
jgi:hypothetical protein